MPGILPDAENSTSTVDTSQCLDNHQDQHSELSQSSIVEESTRKSDDTLRATSPSETSDTYTDSRADEYESGVEVVECCVSKKYLNPREFDKLKIKNLEKVPGICIFEVPTQDNLNNCKGGRP